GNPARFLMSLYPIKFLDRIDDERIFVAEGYAHLGTEHGRVSIMRFDGMNMTVERTRELDGAVIAAARSRGGAFLVTTAGGLQIHYADLQGPMMRLSDQVIKAGITGVISDSESVVIGTHVFISVISRDGSIAWYQLRDCSSECCIR